MSVFKRLVGYRNTLERFEFNVQWPPEGLQNSLNIQIFYDEKESGDAPVRIKWTTYIQLVALKEAHYLQVSETNPNGAFRQQPICSSLPPPVFVSLGTDSQRREVPDHVSVLSRCGKCQGET